MIMHHTFVFLLIKKFNNEDQSYIYHPSNNGGVITYLYYALREKVSNLQSKYPYSARLRENTDQEKLRV